MSPKKPAPKVLGFKDKVLARVKAVAIPAPLRFPIHIGVTLYNDLNRCDLFKQASAMAYVTLLSLIPSLVAIFCILSLFAPLVGDGTEMMDKIQNLVLENLAAGTSEQVIGFLDGMLGNLNLKTIGLSSFGGVTITLILLLRQIEEALNRIWLIRKGRNVFTRFMYFWTFLTLGMVVIGVGIGMSAGFDVDRWVNNEQVQSGMGGHLAGLFSTFFFFFFVYKVVPNCYVAAKNAAIGAAVAAFALMQAGRFYTMFVAQSENYKTLYGVLAQLPIFLTWIYICWIIILIGALISWRMQEGFPATDSEESLDTVTQPLDLLRNSQVKASMPAIALIAIYKNFQQGTGKGLSAQDLAHSLNLPISWIGDALAALQELGYVIASRFTEDDVELVHSTEPYYPAFPAENLPLTKMQEDLARPMADWLSHWRHQLPLDVSKALKMLKETQPQGREMTLADALPLFS